MEFLKQFSQQALRIQFFHVTIGWGDIMFDYIENIKLLDIVSGDSSLFKVNRNRPNHGFIFKISGSSHYDFGTQIMELREGTMLYIPKGSGYTVRRTCEDSSKFIAICFDAEIENARPRLYPMNNFADINHICNTLVHLWLFRSRSDEYKCISIFYNILSQICDAEKADYRSKSQYRIIEPAVEYLKEHIFDCSLKAHELHTYCSVSDTYFRKIFVSQFGTSPQKYIINKRLTQAKNIIDNGEYDSISEVALSVGYEDALYFSKVFRNKYGTAPSKLVYSTRCD